METLKVAATPQVREIKYSFVWTIDNFSCRQEKVLQSSTFSSPENPELEWLLQLYPNGETDIHKDCLALYLDLLKLPYDVTIKCKLSILDSMREKQNENEACNIFKPNDQEPSWGWPRLIKRKALFTRERALLPDDRLTLFCQLTAIKSFAYEHIDKFQFQIPECRWSDDMSILLESQKFSDVTLNVGGRMVHAHKNILAARSRVFNAMFSHEMEEKSQNLVEIVDIEPEVVEEMLRFIYTGEAPNVHSVADKLLAAADKYGLERLKVLCEVSMGLKLTMENAAETLVLADMHNAQLLKTFCLHLIQTHFDKTEAIISNLIDHPHLVTEVFKIQSSPMLLPPFQAMISERGDNVYNMWCHTEDKVIKSSFRFPIFWYSFNRPYSRESITWSFDSAPNIKWCLEAFPDGVKNECDGYLSLYLRLESDVEVNSKFEFSLLNAKEEKIKAKEYTFKFFSGKSEGADKFVENDFIMDEANGVLLNDTLTIVCEIVIIGDTIVKSGQIPRQIDTIHSTYPENSLTWDMTVLLKSLQFSDVTLKAGAHEFRAHKNILAARSRVFSAMFEHEMKENVQNCVDIADMEPEVLKEMLEFIYSGQAPNLDKMADKLLAAADKYDLERLKVMCEESLASALTLENVANTLVLAEMHTAHQLYSFAINFHLKW